MKVTSTIDQLLNAPYNAQETAKAPGYMDKEDFLLLLITQLKYQNPLDPLKNEDFSAQLAQFSSLEQLTNLNSTMENAQVSNLTLTQSIMNSLAASLIGKRVLALNNIFYHVKGHADMMQFDLIDTAKNVIVRVKTDAGTVLYEEELGSKSSGINTFTWDGIDKNGNEVAQGGYIFEVEAEGLNGESVAGSVMTAGLITGVRFRDGQAFLVVNNIEIPLSEVKEVFMEV